MVYIRARQRKTLSSRNLYSTATNHHRVERKLYIMGMPLSNSERDFLMKLAGLILAGTETPPGGTNTRGADTGGAGTGGAGTGGSATGGPVTGIAAMGGTVAIGGVGVGGAATSGLGTGGSVTHPPPKDPKTPPKEPPKDNAPTQMRPVSAHIASEFEPFTLTLYPRMTP